MTREPTASAVAVRRLAVAAQGYTGRYRRASAADVETAIRRLSCVQLDSISAVERSHRIALTSRVGDYPRDTVTRLLAAGRIFEFWAHEACLLPIEAWPHFRRAMANGGRGWYGNVGKTHPHLADEIVAEITERVIPRALLDAPVPSEHETLLELTEQAVRARGVLTAAGAREHWRLRGGVARVRPALDELVATGRLRRLRVDDGGADVFVSPEAELDRPAPTAAVLLTPFDNLLWDRPFTGRILGFDHLIEVYKPPPQRRYGYYVLPFLRGDRVAGRADLKSERKEGRLVVRAFHREDGVRASGALDDALDRALARLARLIGLEEVRR